MNLVHQSHAIFTGASENMNILPYQVLQISVLLGDNTFQNPTISTYDYLPTYLTNSQTTLPTYMDQVPSTEARSFSTSQEIHHIL
jgi:hypothetical protein